MDWYGNDMQWWGYALMGIGMLAFWWLVIAGVVLLVQQLGPSRRTDDSPAAPRSPEELLAESFASGEIDGPEYGDRLATLREHVRS